MKIPKLKKSVGKFLRCESGHITKQSALKTGLFLAFASIATQGVKGSGNSEYTEPACNYNNAGGWNCAYEEGEIPHNAEIRPSIKCEKENGCEIVDVSRYGHCNRPNNNALQDNCDDHNVHVEGKFVIVAGMEVQEVEVQCGVHHEDCMAYNNRVSCSVGRDVIFQQHQNILDLAEEGPEMKAKHGHNIAEKEYFVWGELAENCEDCDLHCNYS